MSSEILASAPMSLNIEEIEEFVIQYGRDENNPELAPKLEGILESLSTNLAFLQAKKGELPSSRTVIICQHILKAINAFQPLLPQLPSINFLFKDIEPFTKQYFQRQLNSLSHSIFAEKNKRTERLKEWSHHYQWAKALGYCPVYEKDGRRGDDLEHVAYGWISGLAQETHGMPLERTKTISDFISKMNSEGLTLRMKSVVKKQLQLFKETIKKSLTPTQFLEQFRKYQELYYLGQAVGLDAALNRLQEELRTLEPTINTSSMKREDISKLSQLVRSGGYVGFQKIIQPYPEFYELLSAWNRNSESGFFHEVLRRRTMFSSEIWPRVQEFVSLYSKGQQLSLSNQIPHEEEIKDAMKRQAEDYLKNMLSQSSSPEAVTLEKLNELQQGLVAMRLFTKFNSASFNERLEAMETLFPQLIVLHWRQLQDTLKSPQTKESLQGHKARFFALLELEIPGDPLLKEEAKKVEKLIELHHFLLGEYQAIYSNPSKKVSKMEAITREFDLPWALEELASKKGLEDDVCGVPQGPTPKFFRIDLKRNEVYGIEKRGCTPFSSGPTDVPEARGEASSSCGPIPSSSSF